MPTGHVGEFLIVNRGVDQALTSEVSVEIKINGQWMNANVSNCLLRESCLPEPVPTCVTLKANAKLHVMAWTGNFCASQCPASCRLHGRAVPGSYRFAVRRCDGKDIYHAPTFELRGKLKKS